MNEKALANSFSEEQIDFAELFYVIKRRLWAIIICMVLGASIAYSYTSYFVQPLYRSSSMIYIFSKTTTVSSAIDLSLGKQLTVDFEILGKSRPVIERVIQDLGLNTTYEALSSSIDVSNPEGSRIIKITVTNPNPKLASDIANTLAEDLAARVAEVIDTTKPSSVENAVPARWPISPNKSRNTMLGGILGALFALAIVLVQYYSDLSVNSEEEVMKYLSLGTLASIPYEKSIDMEKRKNRAKEKKNNNTNSTKKTKKTKS